MSQEFIDHLPPALAERTRIIGKPKEGTSKEQFVLYWMRTALRPDENPALDVAVSFANHLKLPLAIYHGLTERYPFASDKHHTFILECARDVQTHFAQQEISYWMHVERPGHRGPHLVTLSEHAALVVTEDMPTEPLRTWTDHLRDRVSCNICAVDTACVVPMQLVGRSHERAFEFRRATAKLYAERISKKRPAPELERRDISVSLPFLPVDLTATALDELISSCKIDHSIGPVPHTPGGFLSGYKRWEQFKESGIGKYANLRNNPAVDGVSRLSPYLHYGAVSPMRIAREAAKLPSRGPEKYLDELLIWRELAYAFCFYRRDHDSIAAIPRWAEQTLRDHEGDIRKLLSWERMARGRTGDELWDLAQRSLLVHGELHNNVRMTWGKAALNWTQDAVRALERIIDLNHRFALDGRDPASFGGILWCLGQFDRPFTPAQNVFGTVRGRSTTSHAKRMDLDAYRRKVSRPLWQGPPRIAVVGAGLSGLACARTLLDHGCEVSVFEKSVGPGGRMATRETDDALYYDHGAPYFNVDDERFQRYVDSWEQDGTVAKWRIRTATSNGGAVSPSGDTTVYVGSPTMKSISQHLAADLTVKYSTKITEISRASEAWCLREESGRKLSAYDFVVVALPAPQAFPLLASSIALSQQAASEPMKSCWSMMLSFNQPLGVKYETVTVHDSPLELLTCNSSKPNREITCENWVAHATNQWTREHLEANPNDVERIMLDHFWKAIGYVNGEATHSPAHSSVKLWRFARPTKALSCEYLLDEQLKLGACGDWLGQPDVQGAFLSGIALAGRIMGSLSQNAPERHSPAKQLALF